nr:PAS domain-containing protein [Gemmatimonadaceae bacterium]
LLACTGDPLKPMTPESSAQSLSALVAVAAQASGGADVPVAISTELSRLLSASRVTVEFTIGAAEPRGWFVAHDPGLARAPVACACGLSTGGVSGTLVVHRMKALEPMEVALLESAANLLVVALARDDRLRRLEQEVTAHVREVAEQRAFIERVVDSLPFGLYVVDREYRIHAWNHKRETGLQGVARTDAIGRTIFEVLSRQPASLLKQEFDEVFATGRLQQFQMESNAFGDVRTFRISKIPMCVNGNSVTHVITVGEDITDWRAAVDRTAQSEKLAALGQLAAGVMHEINNPLATIAACGESLALHRELAAALPPGAPVPGADPDELLRIIDLEVQRCKRIINGLLDFARTKPAMRESLDLNELVERGVFLLQHHPRFKRVRLETDLDRSRPLTVSGDLDQLVQVLIALCMNAFDASPEGGRIVLRTHRMPGSGPAEYALDVSDEGPGIPRSLHAKIFEPFFTTKPPGQGTGLGLAICYGIVNDHGGELELISGDSPGAAFRMRLPAQTSAPQAVA